MNDGFLNVLKPPALTSHDVVARVRKLAGGARVGHTGTLDPAAAGVLVLAVGAATRLSQYVLALRKSYRAVVVLGIVTDTADAEGTVTRSTPVAAVTAETAEAALRALAGEIDMLPPAYSAARIAGKRAYDLAREGKSVAVRPRKVHVYAIDMLGFTDGDFPQVVLDVECSKGTYVRALATMLGDSLGCGAHLSALVRTAVGDHRLENAMALQELERSGVRPQLISCAEGLGAYPAVTLTNGQIVSVRHGNRLAGCTEHQPGTLVRILDTAGQLAAVAEIVADAQGNALQPRTVLAP